jgi:hypothetical protein
MGTWSFDGHRNSCSYSKQRLLMSVRWATPADGKTQVKRPARGWTSCLRRKSAFAGAVALALSACAALPEDIPPAYVSDATYADSTCEQLAKENMQLSAATDG